MPEAPPPPSPSSAPSEPIDFFALYPTGPDSIPYATLLDAPATAEADLATDTKASVRVVADWASRKNGHEVHQAWAAYSVEMQKLAELGEAEYIAGLAGIGEAGLP